MGKILKIISAYLRGAKANDFPFSKYGFFGERTNDPVYSCDFYIENGCSHVDGMCCDMKTCSILKEHKANINE